MAGQNARLNVVPTVTMLGVMKARLDGTPDLSNCYAQVSDNGAQQDSTSCNIASGPPQKIKLLFSFWGIETFVADPLLPQPLQPMSSCPKPPPAPVMPPPPVPLPPQFKFPPLLPTPQAPVILPPPVLVNILPPATSPPQFKLPPLPPIPPVPFAETSACSHQ